MCGFEDGEFDSISEPLPHSGYLIALIKQLLTNDFNIFLVLPISSVSTHPYYLALPCTLEALLGRSPKVQRGKARVAFGHWSPKVDQPWPFNVAMVLHPFEPGLTFEPEMEPTNADAMQGDGKNKARDARSK